MTSPPVPSLLQPLACCSVILNHLGPPAGPGPRLQASVLASSAFTFSLHFLLGDPPREPPLAPASSAVPPLLPVAGTPWIEEPCPALARRLAPGGNDLGSDVLIVRQALL